ncbi:SPW repeat domain-containing protein [Mucilaginibacter agri]|uniref:SPW repeat-containing integral membrane domain-containing protein n=1 Tax=Mucilaginibacter agri TaxID=2695265 RepID=A0A965ZJA4_9SPHI|nr:hypothetical protein [Mucilaginibacter agri]NCD72150.1 hypothetical protein [Mucilaginibacter agri]
MTTFISTKFLGVLDYITSIVIAASPWLFHYDLSLSAAILFIPVFLGCMQLLMTIFSNYEFGMIKVFPMPAHLFLDGFVGFMLLISPFLYGFAHAVFLPQVILGLILLSMSIFTKDSVLEED